MLGTWNLKHDISTKNKQTHIFFFVGPGVAELYSLFDPAIIVLEKLLSTRYLENRLS